jgi:acetolactate synthase small subunit
MSKIIRLTESDLTKIVKKVITEQEETKAADKIEKVIETPKVLDRLEDIVSNMSEREKMKLKNTLDDLGIDEYSSAKEVHNKIKDISDEEIGGEIEEDENQTPKEKVADILNSIGAGNISAWGGVPAAILIGGALVGTVASPMVAGFAISWGVTGLLMGLSKLLSDKH